MFCSLMMISINEDCSKNVKRGIFDKTLKTYKPGKKGKRKEKGKESGKKDEKYIKRERK